MTQIADAVSALFKADWVLLRDLEPSALMSLVFVADQNPCCHACNAIGDRDINERWPCYK